MKHSVWNNQRGTALPEVLIAILILVSGSITALSLMDSILKLTTASNNQIIAANLAREGLEGFKSVRDSNWLLYSGNQRDAGDKTRNHWNDGFNCAPPAPLECASGPLHLRIYLERIGNPPGDLKWSIDAYDNTNPTFQSDDPAVIISTNYYQLVLDDTLDLTPNNPPDTAPTPLYNYSAAPGTATSFYRQIKVTYLDSHDGTNDGGAADTNDNMVLVESKVFWKEGGQIKQVAFDTILSDWYGRDSHTP